MGRPSLGNALFETIRMVVVGLFKLVLITLSWTCKVIGMTLSKIGEGIEKIMSR